MDGLTQTEEIKINSGLLNLKRPMLSGNLTIMFHRPKVQKKKTHYFRKWEMLAQEQEGLNGG